jgi:hypothetical protein
MGKVARSFFEDGSHDGKVSATEVMRSIQYTTYLVLDQVGDEFERSGRTFTRGSEVVPVSATVKGATDGLGFSGQLRISIVN